MIICSYILDYGRYSDYNRAAGIKMDKPKNYSGLKIQYYREAAGLTRTALSRKLREQGIIISPRRLKGMEEQTACVYVNDLVAFSRFFKVKISELLDE